MPVRLPRPSRLLAAAALAAAAVVAPAAHAGTELPTTATKSLSFEAPGAGPARLRFVLEGFRSLDGDNGYIDILHVLVNGVDVFQGTFDLGGGGADRVLVAPEGTTVQKDPLTQRVLVVMPVDVLRGANAVTFLMESPTVFEGTARAGLQGFDDEAWNVRRVGLLRAR